MNDRLDELLDKVANSIDRWETVNADLITENKRLSERLAAAEAAGRDVLAALTVLESELLPMAALRGEGLSPALIAEHAPKIQAAKALFALAPEVAR